MTPYEQGIEAAKRQIDHEYDDDLPVRNVERIIEAFLSKQPTPDSEKLKVALEAYERFGKQSSRIPHASYHFIAEAARAWLATIEGSSE